MNDRVQISRDSLELGVLTHAEAEELLRVGFLLPTDTFRSDESASWRPLGEISCPTEKKGALTRVKDVASSAGTGLGRVASKLITVTSRGGAAIGAVTNRLLEDYIPRISESVKIAIQKSGGAIGARIHDESFLQKVFGATYDTLPKPVQRFVSEEAFIQFCFKHRSKLIGKGS